MDCSEITLSRGRCHSLHSSTAHPKLSERVSNFGKCIYGPDKTFQSLRGKPFHAQDLKINYLENCMYISAGFHEYMRKLSSIVYQNCMELIIIKCLNVAFEIYIR